MSVSSSPFVSLASVSPEEQAWLWRGRIPLGAITILEGDPGRGKSLITCDWIARVTRGWSFPGDEPAVPGTALLDTIAFPVPAGAVLLQAEDHLATTVVPRLLTAGADLSRVLALASTNSTGTEWRLPRDVSRLEPAIAQVQARLVVIDPLTAYLPAGVQGDAQVRGALQPLAELAQRTGVAIVLVRHLVKEHRRRAISAGAGSMGIIGLARAALAVQPLPDDFDPQRDLQPLCLNGVSDMQPGCKLSAQSLRMAHLLTVVKGNLGYAPPLIYRTGKTSRGDLCLQWLGIHEPRPVEAARRETTNPVAVSVKKPLRMVSGHRTWRQLWKIASGTSRWFGRSALRLYRALAPRRRSRR